MKPSVKQHLDNLLSRYPALAALPLAEAFFLLRDCYSAGGKLLLAGNGGSCADAEHIVGELMKGFLLPRSLSASARQALTDTDPEVGAALAAGLQQGLPAISLASHPALSSAVGNDNTPLLAIAQQLYVLGQPGDVFVAISTSGNAKNLCIAAVAAKAKGMQVLALTGKTGGKLKELADCALIMPSQETYLIQELHLPVYHCLCAMLEEHFFGDGAPCKG